MHEPNRELETRIGRLERELSLLRLQLRNLEFRLGDAEAPSGPDPALTEDWSPAESGHGVNPDAAETEAAAPVDHLEPTAPLTTPPTAPPSATPPTAAHPVREIIAGLGNEPAEPAERTSLERKIGGQVFAIAGALIIIVGLALGVKVAVESGWFRFFPPSLRCVGIAGLGVLFLGAGEYLRTRVRSLAVAGCNAAGIGALYIAAYAAFGFFHLIPAPVAFALMALSAAVGLAVALRHGFLSTGLLALIGAYLVPVLLSDSDPGPFVLPVYLLLLSAAALGLAAARPRPFGAMRDAAWVGTGLLGLVWTLTTVDGHGWLVLAFWAAAWALHQTELLLTASRDALQPAAMPAHAPARSRRVFRRRVEPMLLAIATTAAVVTLAAIVLRHELSLEAWLAPAAGLVVTGMLALAFGGHMRVLRDTPRTDLEALAALHAVQAGALLVTTIALSLSGWVEATAWLAMGVAAVVAGRWIAARSLEVYGLVLLSIATVRIATFDLLVGSAGVPWTTDAPIALAPWTVLIVAAGAAWMAVAGLMLAASRDEDGDPSSNPRPIVALVCAALAVGAWMFAVAHPDSDPAAICLAWLALSLIVRAVARVEPRLRLAEIAVAPAVLAVLPWIVASRPERWLQSEAAVLAHPGLWLGFAVAGVLVALGWLARGMVGDTDRVSLRALLFSIAGVVVFAATSIEIARSAAMLDGDLTARRAAVSIWWGLWGVSMVVAGFWRRLGPVRYVGLALMSVAAVKAVLLDLAGVPQLWRVASFVGLGGLMLAVAVLYGRVSATIGAEESPPDDDESEREYRGRCRG